MRDFGLSSKVVVAGQFRGPPNSGNGGYVCGLLARAFDGPVTALLRAPPPLDTPLDLVIDDGVARLLGEGGVLINADTQKPFGYSDACIELNPHVGGNPATAEQAQKAVAQREGGACVGVAARLCGAKGRLMGHLSEPPWTNS